MSRGKWRTYTRKGFWFWVCQECGARSSLNKPSSGKPQARKRASAHWDRYHS